MRRAAPRYVDEHGRPAEAEALAHHLGVGYLPPSASGVRDIRLRRGERTVDLAMPSRFVTTDSAAVLNASLDGPDIIQIAEHVAAHPLASGALLRVLPTWRYRSRGWCVPSQAPEDALELSSK